MKALTQSAYGSPDTFVVRELPAPSAAADEVVVRVEAVGLNAADWHLFRGKPYAARAAFGLRRPKNPVMGSDVSGVVVQVGSDVTTFAVGDEVMVEAQRGGLAELVAVKATHVARKPASFTFLEAATLPLAGGTALQALRDHGKVRAGESVLVIGASGGVGTWAVQIAVALGAEVTGVCSTRNVDLVRSLGAAHVVDYTATDVLAAGTTYDVVIDMIGDVPLRECRRLLSPGGRYVMVGGGEGGRILGPVFGPMGRTFGTFVLGRGGEKRSLNAAIAKRDGADVEVLREMADAGSLKPSIEKVYAFDDAREALAQIETGRVAGKLAIAVGSYAAEQHATAGDEASTT
ncbi:NAD(P)-dependent alcohol dehydrogenase [Longivirga aurantiaca]|uniref:NAD(P)-dependent alcohol dehydrogenase n=1 Tax=Longivirga aurantiaca TaxID=1837743 RepID=A0ABW1T3B4_9ACTN